MLHTDSDYRDLAQALVPAALRAGAAIMRHFGDGVAVERKSDESPVTAADREAEAIILEALATVAPQIPVVAEEEASAGRIPDVADVLFLVDPLDGTRGFVKGRTAFTVNIGLVIGGRALFGVVYAPALDQLFVTLGPDTAHEIAVAPNEDALARMGSHATRLRTRPSETGRLRIATSRYVSDRLEQRLSKLPAHDRVQIDSSIKFCLIARGDADVYPRFGSINEWDTAAGNAILTAAGGCMTDRFGTPVTYGHQDRDFRHDAFFAWATPEPTDFLAKLNVALD